MHITISIQLLITKTLCARSHAILCDPMDSSPPGSSVHGIFSGKNGGEGNKQSAILHLKFDFVT